MAVQINTSVGPKPLKTARQLTLTLRNGEVCSDGLENCVLGNRNIRASWSWDGVKLEARTCDFGLQPLFYHECKDGIRLSDNAVETLDDSPHLDFRSLSVFLRTGFFIGEDTAFAGVKQLPPSSTLTWSVSGGTRVQVGERVKGAPLRIDREAAIKRYAQLFQKAIEECVGSGDIVVPLSGGRDSRHIAFALDKAGIKPSCFVTSEHLIWRADEDVTVAAKVAEALKVPHIIIKQPHFFVSNIFRGMEEAGFCSDEPGWAIPLVDFLRSRGATVVDGIAGDMMSAGLFQDSSFHALLTKGKVSEAADYVLEMWKGSTGGWESLIHDDLASQLSLRRAHEAVAEEIAKHVGHVNPARSFYFWNRTRRELALWPFLLYKPLNVETPFLNRDLWQFLDGLPYDLVADRAFHTDTIRYAYPHLAYLPYEDKEVRRPFKHIESIAFAIDFCLKTVVQKHPLRRITLMRRAALLVRSHHIWWDPMIAIYLQGLLARIGYRST